MATQSVTIRFPTELLERLDREAEKRGKSRTDYVIELLEAEGGDMAKRLRAIERRLEAMERLLESRQR